MSGPSASACRSLAPSARARRIHSWKTIPRSCLETSGLVDPTAAEHGALGLHVEEARGIDSQQIVVPHDQIRELTRLECALDALLERGAGAVQSGAADRLLDGDALVGAPGVATRVGTSHFRAQPHHRLRRACRVIRSWGRPNARAEKVAHREHMLETLIAVEVHLLSMKIDIAGKRQWNYARRLDAAHEVWRYQRAVLDPQARIAPWQLALQLLVHPEDRVDRDIPVRMRADLPASQIGFARVLVERLARGTADAAVVAETRIGLRQQCRALGDRAVGE